MSTCLAVLFFFFLSGSGQGGTNEYKDEAAGLTFRYPSSYQITEQSHDYSMCSWFVALRSGESEVRINFTGNTFPQAADGEGFAQHNGQWMLGGGAARIRTGGSYRALEGEKTDSRGKSLAVTLIMMERTGKCSALFVTASAEARAVLYSIADSFRFTK